MLYRKFLPNPLLTTTDNRKEQAKTRQYTSSEENDSEDSGEKPGI